ncbi:MAG: DUF1223 domain-containing protein [Chthoniobacterales bacterium]|nr:DUF1223 domain-containing protein [Chthoniobacterales bacterium]
MIRFILFFGFMSMAASSRAADLTFESGPTRTHLLELYTSEGCSSCPPAEAWLSRLKDEPRLWREFVPIAFHVDYWDRLGWRDPFASKQWTARQYEYSARWKSSSVYTPGFVLNGREWRNSGVPAASTERSGVLKLALTEGDTVEAKFAPESGEMRTFDLHVARLGADLRIHVKAGENGGRKLLHDFVVLSLVKEPMTGGAKQVRLPPGGAGQASGAREAIAAWITESGRIEPLQAVGGWLR